MMSEVNMMRRGRAGNAMPERACLLTAGGKTRELVCVTDFSAVQSEGAAVRLTEDGEDPALSHGSRPGGHAALQERDISAPEVWRELRKHLHSPEVPAEVEEARQDMKEKEGRRQ